MEEVKENKFTLPNYKVYVKPIKGRRNWLPPRHAAQFLFGDAHRDYVLPISERSGSLVEPLTPEEKEFFEDKKRSGMAFEVGDLSVFKKEDNFWKKFVVKLDDGTNELDLSKPFDYLKYKVLVANKNEICNSSNKEDISRKWEYKYYISEEKEELKRRVVDADHTKDAWIFYGKLSNSSKDMIDFLKQYKLKNVKFTKFIPDDAKQEFLKNELATIVDNDIHTFIEINKDPLYEDKKLLVEALEKGAVKLNGRVYETPDGVFLGETADQAINFLNAKRNNSVKIQVIARIENSK